jgi:hypothetical protein
MPNLFRRQGTNPISAGVGDHVPGGSSDKGSTWKLDYCTEKAVADQPRFPSNAKRFFWIMENGETDSGLRVVLVKCPILATGENSISEDGFDWSAETVISGPKFVGGIKCAIQFYIESARRALEIKLKLILQCTLA